MTQYQTTRDEPAEFDWKPEPQAAHVIEMLVTRCCDELVELKDFARQLKETTGTRLIDWIDHLAIAKSDEWAAELLEVGFQVRDFQDSKAWLHVGGLFPVVLQSTTSRNRLVLRVDSIVDFLAANRFSGKCRIEGEHFSRCRRVLVAQSANSEWWVVQRQTVGEFEIEPTDGADPRLIAKWQDVFQLRPRHFDQASDGFAVAEQLIRNALRELDPDRVCGLFFTAERDYWQLRNRAARIQKARQDTLGLGWSNHDHHTYRSSREHFARLVSLFELLGLTSRERFYAGREAGWGAQVMEHPRTGIVVFADVDLSPDEVFCDFAHEPLLARDQLGTIGFWCRLHGEAFLEAGMHHLECQFDFDAAREQLLRAGVCTMKPFTDLPHLRQAFTEGEVWPVRPDRIRELMLQALISEAQAEQFLRVGAVGSHLEILQRNDGYKGFNKHGINEIIRDTDPRQLHGGQ